MLSSPRQSPVCGGAMNLLWNVRTGATKDQSQISPKIVALPGNWFEQKCIRRSANCERAVSKKQPLALAASAANLREDLPQM